MEFIFTELYPRNPKNTTQNNVHKSHQNQKTHKKGAKKTLLCSSKEFVQFISWGFQEGRYRRGDTSVLLSRRRSWGRGDNVHGGAVCSMAGAWQRRPIGGYAAVAGRIHTSV